jgi:hypothetical protein
MLRGKKAAGPAAAGLVHPAFKFAGARMARCTKEVCMPRPTVIAENITVAAVCAVPVALLVAMVAFFGMLLTR